MRDPGTPVSIRNLVSNALLLHSQAQYNPSVSTPKSRTMNLAARQAQSANPHKRTVNTAFRMNISAEQYSNYSLNTTFKYGVGSNNIYSDGVYTKQRQSTLFQGDAQTFVRTTK